MLATSIVLFHPDYIVSAGVAYAIFIGVLILTTLISCMGTKYLNKFGEYGAIYVLVASIVLVIAPLVRPPPLPCPFSTSNGKCLTRLVPSLQALCKNRHDATWVFSHFDAEYSNWGSFSFFLSWIGPAGVMIGFGFLTSLVRCSSLFLSAAC